MAGESRDLFAGVFSDWFEGGGRALHVRVATPRDPCDPLAGLLRDLAVVSNRLVRAPVLRELVAPHGWVRRAHLVDNPNGWFPHHHFVCLVPPGDRVTSAKLLDLEASWKGRLGATKARAGRRAGLFARVVESVAEALYAWSSGAPGRGRNEWDPGHGFDDHLDVYDSGSEWDGGDEWGSDSVWDIADRALAGDQRAWRRWEEAGLALRGKRVVQASQMMGEIAGSYAPEVAGGFEVTPRPVLLVASSLWERARWYDVTDEGLRVGRVDGVAALARFWGDRLGHAVEVADRDGVPAMWLVGRQPAEGGTIAIIDYEQGDLS